uniref:Uncharacterized protein n=1 Tax=Timema tahoe TaxID=61484 RepID=A0A7R9ICY5_9NEOP|nr:unnamed protein product [Timema tahoe]
MSSPRVVCEAVVFTIASCFSLIEFLNRLWLLLSIESTLTQPTLVGTRTSSKAHLIWFSGNEEVGARIPTKCTEASGSGSVIGRDPLPPRSVSAMSLQQQQKIGALLPPPTITLTTSEDKKQTNGSSPGDQVKSPHTPTAQTSTPNHVGSLHPTGGGISPHDGTEETQGKRARGGGGGPPPSGNSPWNLNVSAGELLGHTHEELVLLLIQLRRQSAGVCKAMEMCHVEIEAQARLAELDTPRRLEHLQKLEDLKKHLLDLEKQYEKGKPLVNLVDNMVKLGSLYRGGGAPLQSGGEVPSVRERLEFNQKVQEQRLLAQEKRDWDRLSPDQGQLQAKVQELYRLDRLLQEESGTLQSLQQDKVRFY